MRTKTDLLLLKAHFPIDVDQNHNFCAFAYTEINEESALDNAMKSLESSSISSNSYLKGLATKVLSQANKVYESTQNLVNVHHASKMENMDTMSPEDVEKNGNGILVRSANICEC